MAELVRPWQPIKELGVTELIGVDEKVDQNDYSGSVSVDLPGKNPVSGEILSILMISTEDGTGAVQAIDGELFILDADPAVVSGDTALAAAEWPTVLGSVAITNTDFVGDTAGKVNYITNVQIPFHSLTALYFVLLLTSATAVNSDAADNEQIEFNAWYRQES